MAYAAQALNKLNDLQYVEAMRASAEKIWESAQASFQKAQKDGTVTVTKLAHKNLLAMAKRAEQVAETLTALADKIEPMTVVEKKSKLAPKKAATKAAPKAAAAKTETTIKAAPKKVAVKKAAPKAKAVKVEAPAAEVSSTEATA